MRLSDLLFQLFRFLLPPALISTVYLYLYPAAHNCSFPPAKRAEAACYIPGSEQNGSAAQLAPFRLLAFGDPQLEGDTSLPDPNAPAFPSLGSFRDGGFSVIPSIFVELLTHDVPGLLQGYRKRLDLLGNDYYLAHVYRSVRWWTEPTHTVVLGDLLGSQWVSDEEFVRRSERFWGRVFKSGEKVPDSITGVSGRVEELGTEDEGWKNRIIATAGNHDVGYAGDIDDNRIKRFEKAFGPVNWEIKFQLPHASNAIGNHGSFLAALQQPPELRLVMLNSMNLDAPAYNNRLREQTLDFVANSLVDSAKPLGDQDATILLTHIPLHKPAGVCVDAPFFDYFPQNQGGGIKEQNHLSEETSRNVLHSLAGDGRKGKAIVLNGHDHAGCDTYHSASHSANGASSWESVPFQFARRQMSSNFGSGVREITVRSMMGSFGGNAGLLSAWFDEEAREWRFEYASCMLGVQHIWWGVHVLDVVVVGIGLTCVTALLIEELSDRREAPEMEAKKAGPGKS